MVFPLGGVRVDPKGQTVIVQVAYTSGVLATCTSDPYGRNSITNPLTISSPTFFYVAADGPLRVRAQSTSGQTLLDAGINLQAATVTTLACNQVADSNDSPVTTGSTHNFTPSSLPNWLSALATVFKGAGSKRVLCVGDSETAGFIGGSDSNAGRGWPAVLAGMTNGALGLSIPWSTNVGQTDGRWSLGGWTNLTNGPVVNGVSWGGCQCQFHDTGATNVLTFTEPAVTNSFDVYYLTRTGDGSIDISVNGTLATTVNTNAAQGVAKVTVAATRQANNVVTFKGHTGNAASINICGIEGYDTTVSQIIVGNAGISSSQAAGWATTVEPGWGALNCIELYAPALSIITLGINDMIAGGAPSTYMANMQAIIAAAQASGDVVLVIQPPVEVGVQPKLDPLVHQYRDVVLGFGLPTVDLLARWQSYAKMNAAGLYSPTGAGIHPNVEGYADIGNTILTALTTALGAVG